MEEQQHFPPRDAGAGVHLRAASALGLDYPIGMGAGELGSPVLAAAVDHDHLGAALPKRRKGLQRACDDRRLVERRNDDGKRGHALDRELRLDPIWHKIASGVHLRMDASL